MSTTSEPAATPAAPDRARARPALGAGWIIAAIGVLLAVLLALPGQTITTKYVNDLLVFLDGAHRIWSGQVPNVDFHSSLGPLSFYLPAAGLGLSGRMAGAMPVGMALAVLLFAAIAVHVLGSRMRPAIGIPLAAFLLLVAAVPANPGEAIADLSFAMFYNRLGWSALGLLFVLYLQPGKADRRQGLLDAACAATLVLFLAYTKATYGLVGLAFLVFLATDRRQGRWALAALVACAAVALLVELVWHGSAGYIADIGFASRVSGDLPDLPRLVGIVLVNLADLVVYLVFAVLLLVLRKRFRDLLFVGFTLATGILLIEQNFQITGILTLGASAAVIAERLARSAGGGVDRPLAIRAGLPMLLLVLILPPIVHNAIVLGLHATLALTRSGDQVPLPEFDGIRLARLWSDGPYGGFARYNETMRDGAELLARLDVPAERVLVFDFVSPFSAGLGLVPPHGDFPWHHWGRTIDEDAYPAAEELFADVRIILDPKAPIEHWTAQGMARVYAGYVAANYRLVAESPFWRAYVATRDPGEPSLRSDSSAARQSTSAQP